jgi:hypothetical protein
MILPFTTKLVLAISVCQKFDYILTLTLRRKPIFPSKKKHFIHYFFEFFDGLPFCRYENDIAILKLLRPSLFNSYIWPICMPPVADSYEGYSGVVLGE